MHPFFTVTHLRVTALDKLAKLHQYNLTCFLLYFLQASFYSIQFLNLIIWFISSSPIDLDL